MHAGLLALPWPDDPLGRLWHACTILREHRGDSHLAACVAHGLTGLEANLLTELRVGWDPQSYTASRGWSPEAMDAATAVLTARGLVARRRADRRRAPHCATASRRRRTGWCSPSSTRSATTCRAC